MVSNMDPLSSPTHPVERRSLRESVFNPEFLALISKVLQHQRVEPEQLAERLKETMNLSDLKKEEVHKLNPTAENDTPTGPRNINNGVDSRYQRYQGRMMKDYADNNLKIDPGIWSASDRSTYSTSRLYDRNVMKNHSITQAMEQGKDAKPTTFNGSASTNSQTSHSASSSGDGNQIFKMSPDGKGHGSSSAQHIASRSDSFYGLERLSSDFENSFCFEAEPSWGTRVSADDEVGRRRFVFGNDVSPSSLQSSSFPPTTIPSHLSTMRGYNSVPNLGKRRISLEHTISSPSIYNNTTTNYLSKTPTIGFRPMQAVLEPMARNPQHISSAKNPDNKNNNNNDPDTGKFSDRYFGMHTDGNASADHLSDHDNCALWLRNLPPDVTYKELLSSVRNIGRIWCSFINQPDFVSHNTAAAKVVFFTSGSARLFLAYVDTMSPNIRGFRIKVGHNRIKYGERPVQGNASRVLIVTGREDFVNPESLTKFFTDKFVFQLDEVTELVRLGGRAVVEFRFGSYRCQAQMAKMALDRCRPDGFERAEFGQDPCEHGETLMSYRMAMERIQGKGF